jgi:hypothetical protein
MNSLDGSLWQMAQPTLDAPTTPTWSMEHFAETWNFVKVERIIPSRLSGEAVRITYSGEAVRCGIRHNTPHGTA